MVDWNVALSTATRLVKPGPEISREGAAPPRSPSCGAARRGPRRTSPRSPACEAPSGTAPVLVVDRPRLDPGQPRRLPADPRPAERQGRREDQGQNPALVGIGARITGVEVGALLSYLAPKVLGQFDPFFPGVGAAGATAASDRPPGADCCWSRRTSSRSSASCSRRRTDFRLWVCLHEETHRVQFTAVPWLRGLSERADRPGRRLRRPRRRRRCPDAPRRHQAVSARPGERGASCRSSTWSRRRPSGRSSTGSPP